LYNPKQTEYGIKTLDEVIEIHKNCPKCNAELRIDPIIEPVQGKYAGSTTILYRGTSKVFNMWSQIARTVILAHIKKEGRDRKNSGSYTNHLDSKQRPLSGVMVRFINELRDLHTHDENALIIINALEWLTQNDDKPYDGLIGKLVNISRLPRQNVTTFLAMLKLRSTEITDSPISRAMGERKINRRSDDHDEE
jgi:hypothetical protein